MAIQRIETLSKPAETVQEFYTKMYRQEKQDSPDPSRYSLERRAKIAFDGLPETAFILDLGSGRRIFEREYFRAFGVPNYRMITLDFADINQTQLLVNNSNLNHFRADGRNLPFADASFSGVISNMALDFMENGAIGELNRVLKTGCLALANLHHPSLIPDNINNLLKNRYLNSKLKAVLTFWKYLKDNDVLFKSEEQIRETFGNNGLNVLNVKEATNNVDKWWEVDMVKLPEAT